MQQKQESRALNRIDQLCKKHRTYLIQYQENLEQQNKSPHTVKSYQNDLLQFLEWLEFGQKRKAYHVDSTLIGEYLTYLTAGGEYTIKPDLFLRFKIFVKRLLFFENIALSPAQPIKRIVRHKALGVSSRKRHMSCIKNFFEFLKQKNEDHGKYFKTNPVKPKIHGIKLKDVDVNHTQILLQKDWIKIQETVYRVEDKLITGLLYWGGLRLSEVRNLQISNFDFDTKTITFSRKGGQIHTLYPQNSPKIFELLDLHLSKKRISSGNIFQNSKGKAFDIKSIYNWVLRICQKSSVSKGVTPHSFRKACATYLYFQTKDLLYVRDYLNHSDAKVTQSYIDSKLLQSGNSPSEEIRLTVDFPMNSTYAERDIDSKVLN